MPGPVSLEIDAGVGVISADHPPVNALSLAVRKGLEAALQIALADPTVEAIVLACEGKTFFAGADITEFGGAIEPPSVPALVTAFEASTKPVIAAIHGTALGGGFELALGCHYRIAADTAKVGLPEVQLGILPGAGGTQRVPRLIGAARALEMLTSGRHIAMAEANACGLVDHVVSADRLREEATSFARSVAALPPPRVRDRVGWVEQDRKSPGLFDEFLEDHADAFRGFKAPRAIVEAVKAAVTFPFDQAVSKEWALFEALAASPEAAAQQAFFFALREAAKPPSKGGDTRPLQSVSMSGSARLAEFLQAAFSRAGVAVGMGRDTSGQADLVLQISKDGAPPSVRLSAPAEDSSHTRLSFFPDLDDLRLIEMVYSDAAGPLTMSMSQAVVRLLGKPCIWSRGGGFVGDLFHPLASQIALMQDAGYGVAALRRALMAFGFRPSSPVMQYLGVGGAPEMASGTSDEAPEGWQDLIAALFAPVVVESRSLLDRGIVRRPSDIDVAAVIGYGWPEFRAGLMSGSVEDGCPRAAVG